MGNDNPRTGKPAEHACQIVEKPTHCEPQSHCPDQGQDHDGHCEGQITGGITLNCNNHCHQLKSRSFVVNVAPQTEVQLRAFMQNSLNAWQNAGYIVLAHSVIDTGAGWTFMFTVGWYV